MNFGYESKEDKDIIKNYNKYNDKIVINYLDGNQQEIVLTDDNEKKLLNEMLEQAKERNLSFTVDKIIGKRRHIIWREILDLLLCSTDTIEAVRFNILDVKPFSITYSMLAGVWGVLAIINGVEYKIYNDKLNELKKYAIYIDVIEKLEKANEINVNNLLKINNNTIDINNLDNYSLKEVRTLRNNIKNNVNYTKYFNEDEKYLLTKRLSK